MVRNCKLLMFSEIWGGLSLSGEGSAAAHHPGRGNMREHGTIQGLRSRWASWHCITQSRHLTLNPKFVVHFSSQTILGYNLLCVFSGQPDPFTDYFQYAFADYHPINNCNVFFLKGIYNFEYYYTCWKWILWSLYLTETGIRNIYKQ